MAARIAGTLDTRDRIIVALCRRSYRFYNSVCLTVRLRTERGSLKIPLIRSIGLRNLSFDHNPLNPTYKENWLGRMLAAIYGYRSGTFVDVGANIGKIIVSLAFHDAKIRYIGFEPNLNCCFYLNQLIELNGLYHYRLIPVALGEETAAAPLAIGEDFDVRGSIISGFHPTAAHSREVQVEPGDRFLAGEPVAILKIDAEGSELPALRGLSNTIAASRPVLLLEILDFAEADQPSAGLRREAAVGIADYLSAREYRLYRMTSRLELQAVPLATLPDNLHAVENNYIAVPAGEDDRLIQLYHRSAGQ